VFAFALGLVLFTAQWIGGDPRSGLVSLGISSERSKTAEPNLVSI
jgi:hypothetical protein